MTYQSDFLLSVFFFPIFSVFLGLRSETMKKFLFLVLWVAVFLCGCASAEKTEEKNGVKNNVHHLQWSSRSPEKLDWQGALNYCKNVTDGGFKDWRLPNIDELRDSIENCSKTEAGGGCKVSDKNGCLSSECRNPKGSCACERKNKSVYSKFDGYDIGLWSSSELSDNPDSAWGVVFYSAMIGSNKKSGEFYVRCVRTPDENDKRFWVEDKTIVMGALDRRDIDAYIRRNLAKVLWCYQKGLEKNPELVGRVVFNFIISESGDVSSVKVHRTTLGSAEVENCVAEQIKKIKFPAPKGGGIVIVNYPFTFKNKEE